MIGRTSPSWHDRLEYAFVVSIVAGIIYAGWFFSQNGYLPQPFFYEPWGTFMDWYSLTGYSHSGGAYDVGGTIYPPLSFVLLKFLSISDCYVNNNSEWARDCDWLGIPALFAIFSVNIVLTFLSYRKHDRHTYIPRAFALSLGLPMIFTLERGNLLLFCYACVVLAYGPLVRSARLRWLFGGLAVNFKVYLIGAMLAPLLRRRWIQTEGMLLSAVSVYLLTFAILGEGSPAEIIGNLTSYAAGFGSTRLNDLWYPSSMIPAITLLNGGTFPITTIMNSDQADFLVLLANGLTRVSQAAIVLAAIATWLRPEVVPRHRVIFFAIAMAVISSEAGGYTEMLLLFFVFMERWRGVGRPIAIIIAYALCVPAEYVLTKLPPVVQVSWLLGAVSVFGEYGVGLFSLLRPLIALGIIWCLASVTLRDVWDDIQRQGWKTRWRYRRDARILAGPGNGRRPGERATE